MAHFQVLLIMVTGIVVTKAWPVPMPQLQYQPQNFALMSPPRPQFQPYFPPYMNFIQQNGQQKRQVPENRSYPQHDFRPIGPGPQSNAECKRISGGQPNVYRFQCHVKRVEDITLKYDHILWLPGALASAPAVDVVVPNYRVEEIIKAGFKTGTVPGSQPINILLQRPVNTVNAEVDIPAPNPAAEPQINIQYEPATSTRVHYPNDQGYRPLSGPILPPLRNNF